MMEAGTAKVLVTGASGFIGSALCDKLNSGGYTVAPAVRRSSNKSTEVVVGDVGPETHWDESLAGCHAVIHAAARVHIMHDKVADPLQEFRRVNVAGTLRLAMQAHEAGVRRFVYLSSIKVNGEIGCFSETSSASPQDDYAISKLEAEQQLLALADRTGLEVVIIRPPLVYGPGVKANFLSMMRWIHKSIPLPFGAIHNKRSLVGLDNLIDLIMTCIGHPAAANQVFLVSDDEDLSTTELLRRTAIAMGITPRLVPVPQAILEQGLKLLGKNDLARR